MISLLALLFSHSPSASKIQHEKAPSDKLLTPSIQSATSSVTVEENRLHGEQRRRIVPQLPALNWDTKIANGASTTSR